MKRVTIWYVVDEEGETISDAYEDKEKAEATLNNLEEEYGAGFGTLVWMTMVPKAIKEAEKCTKNFYVVTEKTRDGEFEYYSNCIVKLEEGEEPSEELFLQKLYEEIVLEFDGYCKAWQLPGDYRLINVYSWRKIESNADIEILNKYGIH